MDCGANRGETYRLRCLGAYSKASDAELVPELARTVGDSLSHLLGLEQDRVAALREHFANQPLHAADRHLCQSRAVLQRRRAAFGAQRAATPLR